MQAREPSVTISIAVKRSAVAVACAQLFSLSVLAAPAWAASPDADDAVVVTATRFPEKALDAPAGLTVIDSAQIAQSPATTLPELLSMEAGIVTRDSSGSPDRSIDLRGMGITGDQNTLVLVNGQRLNDIELNTVRWMSIPLQSIERIEIMRGSGAVLYGGGATGGTINIITKDPSALPSSRPYAADAAVDYGSFNTRQTSVHGGYSGDTLSASLYANDYYADNYRQNNNVAQQNIDGEIRLQHGLGDAYFKFGADNQYLRLPGARTQAQLISDPQGTATPNDYAGRDGGHATLGGSVNLGFGELDVDLGYRNSDRTSYFQDYTFGIFNTYVDTEFNVWSFNPRLKVPFHTGTLAHSLVLGIDADDWHYDSRRAPSLETITSPLANVVARQQDQAFYIQDNIALSPGTKLTLGGRVQRFYMRVQDLMNPVAYANGEQTRTPHAWEVALRQDLWRNWSAYGRLGTSFRVATVDEVYSQFGGPLFDAIVTLLEPQTSRDAEAGLQYRSGNMHARLGAFDMKLNNEIQFFAPTFSNINLPPTERRGLELEAGFEPLPGLTLSAGATAIQARYRSGHIGAVDVTGNTIPLVPRDTENLTAAWRFAGNFTLAGSWRRVGKQYYDNDQSNTFPTQMPAYDVADVKLGYQRGPFGAALAVTNLFDKQYYSYAIRNAAGTSFNAYPEQPRAFMATLRYAL
jgi:iron complex outermembrane receptor protein